VHAANATLAADTVISDRSRGCMKSPLEECIGTKRPRLT
jgi:hypothetical protein